MFRKYQTIMGESVTPSAIPARGSYPSHRMAESTLWRTHEPNPTWHQSVTLGQAAEQIYIKKKGKDYRGRTVEKEIISRIPEQRLWHEVLRNCKGKKQCRDVSQASCDLSGHWTSTNGIGGRLGTTQDLGHRAAKVNSFPPGWCLSGGEHTNV